MKKEWIVLDITYIDETKRLAIESLLPALDLWNHAEECIVVESHTDEYEPLKFALDEKERIARTTALS